MKVAIFTDNFYPELSGITDSLVTLSKALVKMGHQVEFYAPYYAAKDYRVAGFKDFEPFEQQRIRVIRLPSIIFSGSPTGQGRIALPTGWAIRALKKFKPDVIYTNTPFGAGLEALLCSWWLKIPLVGTDHTPPSEFIDYSPIRFNWLKKASTKYFCWYYNRCRFVSGPCQSLLDEMERYGLQQKHRVIPNPIDLSHFYPVSDQGSKVDLKKRFGLSKNTVLYTGRLAAEKHIDVIIRAISQAKQEIPDLSLGITGHGEAESRLRNLVDELDLAGCVKFFGYVDKDTFSLLYRASDLFVIMSTAESQSLSLMQAMASGLPAIGARARALPEYIDQNSGVIVPVGDVKELAAQIIKLFKNPDQMSRLGMGGLEVAGQCAPERVAKEWEEIFGQAVSNKLPKISLIIPAYNEEKYLGDCLQSAVQNSQGRFHEIIVIDNASTDHTSEIAARFPGVRVVYEARKGLTQARARGLAEAKGDLLAYIDADTRLTKNWLDLAIKFYANHPGAVCLSGPYHYYDGSTRRNFVLHFLWWLYAPIVYRLVGFMVLGGNFIAKKEALVSMGGFDRSIEFYGEDTDIARRLAKFGQVVFRMDFFIFSSSRRFMKEGLVRTNFIYTMNFLWEVFFHRPFTREHKDIRPNK